MEKIIEQVIQRSNNRIPFEKGSPFTQEGYEALKVEISSFINEIIQESYKVAKRNKSDLISKSNIETASFNLIKKHSGEKKKYLSPLGGFLLGFAVNKIFETLANNESFANSTIIVILITGIIGAFLLGTTLIGPKA